MRTAPHRRRGTNKVRHRTPDCLTSRFNCNSYFNTPLVLTFCQRNPLLSLQFISMLIVILVKSPKKVKNSSDERKKKQKHLRIVARSRHIYFKSPNYSTNFFPVFSSSLGHCVLSSGLPHSGYHFPAGEHPGHHSHSKEQEPSLTHVLLCVQVNSSHHTTFCKIKWYHKVIKTRLELGPFCKIFAWIWNVSQYKSLHRFRLSH